MKTWKELALERENQKLKGHIKACLELIDDLSNLDAPLFEADVPFAFRKKYVIIVNRAKRAITPKKK